MSQKLIINTNLLRKESEFQTKSCVVEKATAVSHGEFEYLKNHPLRDNDLIAENTDLMYCDSDDNYHCLLIYDKEQGDGLLIESEGCRCPVDTSAAGRSTDRGDSRDLAYARYAQYIPSAKRLVEMHQNPEITLTNGEKKLHELLNTQHALLAVGICLSANEVPRIAQMFGLDTSVRVNMMSVSSTVSLGTRAVKMLKK